MIKWVKANAEQPFFLFYAITLPHGHHEIDDFGIYADKPWKDIQNGETKNLAAEKPEGVERAKEIFEESHCPDSNWPLGRRSDGLLKSRPQAWIIKRERDRTGSVPPDAVPYER